MFIDWLSYYYFQANPTYAIIGDIIFYGFADHILHPVIEKARQLTIFFFSISTTFNSNIKVASTSKIVQICIVQVCFKM
jgi:hypothetical protein